ncbi:V-type ATP synthase subunit I [Chitinispirillum alkaliphilum]|nr:V-type ATP synthase subunit I [Chitinispirillum alkaliphilum]
MIVQMKKMDLLLYHREKEAFLEKLRDLGVVHITESEAAKESHLVQDLAGVVHLTERVITSLKKIQAEEKIAPESRDLGDPMELLHRFDDLESKKDKLEQDIAVLQKDRQALEPWGDFDPKRLRLLEEAGITMRLFVMPAKKFDTVNWSEYILEVVNRGEASVHFVVLERGEKSDVPEAEEQRIPEYSLSELDQKISDLKTKLSKTEKSLRKMVACISQLEAFHAQRLNQLKYEKARHSLKSEAEGKLLSLSGWFPDANEKSLSQFLNKFPAWYSFRDPLVDEDVPVKLKNRNFPTLFEPITGMYSLPSYNELDVTPFMAPFFALFFGLCLGDVGYGLILLIGAIIGRAKVSAKLRPVMSLGIFLGIATIVSGFLLNTFFGQTIFGGPGIEEHAIFPVGVQIFAPLSAQVGPAGQVFPAMNLALLLGVIQMLVGIAMQSRNRMRTSGFLAGLQPVSTMLMIMGGFVWAAHVDLLELGIGEFTVGPVGIGAMLLAIPEAIGMGVTILGLVTLFLFNNIDKKIYIRPLTGLWDFYNFLTGILQTLLSYLRLFALGLASGLLGGAFNQIAFMFIETNGEINYFSWGLIGTVLILVLGHSLNLILSAISAFVHPLRLTFVEFYGAIGFRGGSKPYIPFAKVER